MVSKLIVSAKWRILFANKPSKKPPDGDFKVLPTSDYTALVSLGLTNMYGELYQINDEKSKGR